VLFPAATLYEKNSINRADVTTSAEDKTSQLQINNSTDLTTEKSAELDSFQPELQGGFKPIYPPNYRQVGEEEKEKEQREESLQAAKKPVALALTGAQILSTGVISSSSSSSSSSSTSSQQTTVSTTTTTTAATTSSTTTTTKAPQIPNSNPTKKSSFETSLAALLFGEDDEFENEARKSESQTKSESKSQSQTESVKTAAPSGPRNVARMGPRSLRS